MGGGNRAGGREQRAAGAAGRRPGRGCGAGNAPGAFATHPSHSSPAGSPSCCSLAPRGAGERGDAPGACQEGLLQALGGLEVALSREFAMVLPLGVSPGSAVLPPGVGPGSAVLPLGVGPGPRFSPGSRPRATVRPR